MGQTILKYMKVFEVHGSRLHWHGQLTALDDSALHVVFVVGVAPTFSAILLEYSAGPLVLVSSSSLPSQVISDCRHFSQNVSFRQSPSRNRTGVGCFFKFPIESTRWCFFAVFSCRVSRNLRPNFYPAPPYLLRILIAGFRIPLTWTSSI